MVKKSLINQNAELSDGGDMSRTNSPRDIKLPEIAVKKADKKQMSRNQPS